MDQKKLRFEINEKRKTLDVVSAREVSRSVCERFLQLSELTQDFWRGKKVGAYTPFRGELDISPLISALREMGAEVFLPVVLDQQLSLMEFRNERGTQILPSDIQVIFVPGVAFGLHGERLGMGGGFYDRLLSQAPKALRIALTFDFQVLPTLEQNPWDQTVHWIWTESRELKLCN